MSWFGETFGDSLTSLKGQITKITKEVLADDNTSNEKTEPEEQVLKELQSLCESKDLEITSLRDELNKLQDQYKSQVESLNEGNVYYKRDTSSKGDTNNDIHITELEAQLKDITEERNHLNKCIDELQAEHEVNLYEVMLMRDKYKNELEELNKNYTAVKLQLEEVSINESDSKTTTKDLQKLLNEKNSELTLLRGQSESFKSELEASERAKNETLCTLKNEVQKSTELKQALDKLLSENMLLKKEKQNIEDDYKQICVEKENLIKKLGNIQGSSTDVQAQLQKVNEEKEELLRQIEESKKLNSSTVSIAEVEEKLRNMFNKLNINVEQNTEGLNEYLSLLEKMLSINQKNSEERCRKLTQDKENLEEQLKILKEENFSLKNELKLQSDKFVQKEKKYQEDIAAARKHLEDEKMSNQKLLEVERQSQINGQSQSDDVKRLEQEVNGLLYLCETKTNEIEMLGQSKSELEQDLCNLRAVSDSMKEVNNEVQKLREEILQFQMRETQLQNENSVLQEKWSTTQSENNSLCEINNKLQLDIDELQKKLMDAKEKESKTLENESLKSQAAVSELQSTCTALQTANATLKNEYENMKAQIIVRESSIVELMKSNATFQDEINKLQTKCSELQKYESDLEKWKNVSLELEIQNQDLIAKIETLEGDSVKLRGNIELVNAKDSEIQQLRQENMNLLDSCNRLHQEIERKLQAEQIYGLRDNELQAKFQEQEHIIAELHKEKIDLTSMVEKFQEQMKIQVHQNEELTKKVVQQHRRSKSAADFETVSPGNNESVPEAQTEVAMLKQAVLNEQIKFKELYSQLQGVTEKEGNARKEFERLKQHLIEVEDHYTQEALENEKIITDLKAKLMAAEEQMKNSSTLYTSAKIRDNQHVESLQSQVRLITVQRDDYQAKLSATEDEIQKHKASLTSLQIVLEQFQQDKNRELEGLAVKYEKQMELTRYRVKELEMEREAVQKQLEEAKNGLKAASRLGEQLERKSQQVVELEQNLGSVQMRITELEQNLEASNQSVSGKVDKSLIKNLLVGYILSPKADRKSQVLRILASVLDFDPEEREKMGVDATSSGWLSNILHPKTGGPPTNESLSEAFIKFLENESRPQPQLKLVPDQYKLTKSRSSSTTTKPHGVFSELVLPTFNSPQDNESSVILKNVLKDS
ncbi:hypothetical protein RUM44_009276 [Polyplax serrata]|uniref:GRIP domain-containing protein n=1 Tax=Polyplax serrata TaxID=468196 RepID=A0ABR1AS83_POLSC